MYKIMQDVSQMVNDQGKQLDVAEKNINDSNANVKEAEVQLREVSPLLPSSLGANLPQELQEEGVHRRADRRGHPLGHHPANCPMIYY